MKVYDITPVAKPRMTRADKWKKRPAVLKYRAFCDECRIKGMTIPESGAHIVFYIPMPESWSKKKKEKYNLYCHQSRPDIDNLVKSVLDALFDDDSHIYDIRASKFWSYTGSIYVK